ncbi:TonB-dependent receptor [bacterium]|nr:TonB-dependent receptor [bacterium]
MTRTVNKFVLALAILLGVLTASAADLSDLGLVLVGNVTDPSGDPIVGATVSVLADGRAVAGAATDSDGRFSFGLSPYPSEELQLRVTSVGFAESVQTLVISGDTVRLTILLEPTAIDLGAVAVYPTRELVIPNTELSSEVLRRGARKSLVPTNPVGAIRNPEVVRVGSAHSSRIRIFGDSPVYYLNGLPIGTDPDHYGMFTVLPASSLDHLRLNLYGTDAGHASPSSAEMSTPVRFGKHRSAEFSFSTIEATGTASVGTDRLFALGTLRKSVLDKLVSRLDIHSNRQTIPPTNFQDISLYTGWKANSNLRLFVDQYHVQDFLAYQVDSYVSRGLVDTYQHSTRHYIASRLEGTLDDLRITGGLALHDSYEEYRAYPVGSTDRRRLLVDLRYQRTSALANARADYLWRDYRFAAGIDNELVVNRRIHLKQRNWNFLSPFASSNNPYIYQEGLNLLYGAYDNDDSEHNSALYAEAERELCGYEIEGGLRAQRFSNLAEGGALLFRARISGPVYDEIRGRLSLGTYAENPATNILEPYQVIVYDNLERLKPIKSAMISLSLEYREWAASLFVRSVNNLPALTPDFGKIDPETGSPTEGFLQSASIAEADYRGLALSWSRSDLPIKRLSVQASYAYTHSSRTQNALTYPDDLDSPHRFRVQADHDLNDRFSFGGEFTYRSGYPYTPFRTTVATSASEYYNESYYDRALALENSERFPASVSLNLYGDLRLGRGSLFFSISNVTNRANPIISTASGYIHDAGIMPTVGYRVSF